MTENFSQEGSVQDQETMERLHKSFEVSSLSRLDLIQAGYTEARVLALSDAEMEEIARRMGDLYTDSMNGYWEDLELVAERMFGEKEHEGDW
jgi:hypothetical protein